MPQLKALFSRITALGRALGFYKIEHNGRFKYHWCTRQKGVARHCLSLSYCFLLKMENIFQCRFLSRWATFIEVPKQWGFLAFILNFTNPKSNRSIPLINQDPSQALHHSGMTDKSVFRLNFLFMVELWKIVHLYWTQAFFKYFTFV